jgi:hypothetical protein
MARLVRAIHVLADSQGKKDVDGPTKSGRDGYWGNETAAIAVALPAPAKARPFPIFPQKSAVFFCRSAAKNLESSLERV